MNEDKQPIPEKAWGSELMSEMTVYFRKNHPELPANIWISNRIGNMSPRMWIQRNKDEEVQKEDTFTMAIDDAQTVAGDSGSGFSIKDFEYFQRFILINKSLLLAYWKEELDTEDLVKRLVLDMSAFDWEIARLGFLETEPRLEIYVCTDDPGHTAHFHIRDVETKGRIFHT